VSQSFVFPLDIFRCLHADCCRLAGWTYYRKLPGRATLLA